MALSMSSFRTARGSENPAEDPGAVQQPPTRRGSRGPAKGQSAPTPPGDEWKQSSKPRVVLLPTKDRAASTLRKNLRNAGGVSAGMLLVTVIAYIIVAVSTSGAHSTLDTHNQLKTQHEGYITDNAPITEYVEGIALRKAAAVDALLTDTDYSRVLSEIDGANTVGATITAVSTGDVDLPQSSSPFADASAIGFLNVTGRAASISDVGRLVEALNTRGKMLTDAYATSAMGDGDVEFTITLGYTEEALSFKGVAFEAGDGDEDPAPAQLPGAAETEAPADEPETQTPSDEDEL